MKPDSMSGSAGDIYSSNIFGSTNYRNTIITFNKKESKIKIKIQLNVFYLVTNFFFECFLFEIFSLLMFMAYTYLSQYHSLLCQYFVFLQHEFHRCWDCPLGLSQPNSKQTH